MAVLHSGTLLVLPWGKGGIPFFCNAHVLQEAGATWTPSSLPALCPGVGRVGAPMKGGWRGSLGKQQFQEHASAAASSCRKPQQCTLLLYYFFFANYFLRWVGEGKQESERNSSVCLLAGHSKGTWTISSTSKAAGGLWDGIGLFLLWQKQPASA